jgi:hypothetical protein
MRYLTCSNGFCHLLLNPVLWIDGDSSDDYPLNLLYDFFEIAIIQHPDSSEHE